MKATVEERRSLVLRLLIGSASPFIVLCGIIAIFYLVYRVGLVAFPAVVVGESIMRPGQVQPVVCDEKDTIRPRDPAPLVSTAYQQRVWEQSKGSANLAVNFELSEDQNGQPKEYGYNNDQKDNYEFGQEGDTRFLRVKSSGQDTDDQPAWLMPPVRLTPHQTYAYNFSYRGNAAVRVTIETKVKDKSELEYRNVTTLAASKEWRDFSGHIDSGESVESMRIIATPASTGTIDTKAYGVRSMPGAELKRGMVSVTFDDGVGSVETHALPILDKYQIRSTQYVMSDVASQNAATYMNVSTLKKLKEGGHEIGSHSLTHCNQSSLEKVQVQENAAKSKEMLERHNLGPIRSFTYPFGRYDSVTQEVYSKEYQYVRTSDAGYNDRYFDAANIRSMSVLDSTSDKTFQAWLEYAKVNHLWVVLVYHRVNESGTYNVATDQLDRQLNMVAGSGLRVLPLSEAADAARSEAPRSAAAQQAAPAELPRTGTGAIWDLVVVGLLAGSTTYWVLSRRALMRAFH